MAEKEPHRLMRDRAPGLPPPVASLLEQGATALDAHDSATAEKALLAALVLAPDCAEAFRLLGVVQHVRGDFTQAVTLLRRALQAKPGDALILMNLATSLHAQGETDVALSCLKRACAAVPDFAPAWFNLGRMYMLQWRPAGAVTAFHRALDIEPDHVPARISLAQAQSTLGAIGPAMASYREVVNAHPSLPNGWLGLAELETGCFTAGDVAQLQRAMHLPETDVHARIALGFALARALEDQGDFDGALRALHKANGVRYRQLNWNPTLASKQADALIEAFPSPLAGASDASQGEQVIFIVGLPCSGSALTAQMLDAHPQVDDNRELPDLQQLLDDESRRRGQVFPQWVTTATAADWSRLGEAYLARTARWRNHAPRFIDSRLANWQLVGAALAMLPGARVIDSRRDPLETCLACYRQLFGEGEDYSFNLDHMVGVWRDHDRVARHWRQLFPGRFIEHDFEAWQAEPETRIRRLLEFCALDADPACLAVSRTRHAEYTTVAPPPEGRHARATTRSSRYGARLDRLRALLAAAGAGG